MNAGLSSPVPRPLPGLLVECFVYNSSIHPYQCRYSSTDLLIRQETRPEMPISDPLISHPFHPLSPAQRNTSPHSLSTCPYPYSCSCPTTQPSPARHELSHSLPSLSTLLIINENANLLAVFATCLVLSDPIPSHHYNSIIVAMKSQNSGYHIPIHSILPHRDSHAYTSPKLNRTGGFLHCSVGVHIHTINADPVKWETMV